MDQRVFYEIFGKERFILRDDQERNKLVLLDNVRSHGRTEELGGRLAALNTSVYLTVNPTHKVQP